MKTSDSIVKIIAHKKVWLALTILIWSSNGRRLSNLLTTWEVGTPIIFRNEWNGQVFEQKGKVLEFCPETRLKSSLFFPHPNLQDIPEHHFMTYELTESEVVTSLLVRQEDPRPSPPNESAGGDEGPRCTSSLKELVEVKMP